MKLSSVFAAALLGLSHYAAATAVFAHFMIDNTANYDSTTWEIEFLLAQAAGIDAFALNIAAGSNITAAQLPSAFSTAQTYGFQLFFSFDYAGNGAWEKEDVMDLLTLYGTQSAYFKHEGSLPLVTTFEGPASSADWVEIKSRFSCFFIPDWSSLGAGPALAKEAGVADGLFSWAAWPYDALSMDTYTDVSYTENLGGKPFIMGVSPWFYTNMPGYSKNWMWPSMTMSLWAERWIEVLFLKPAYVEIISWNDFGESHYIGDILQEPPYLDDTYMKFDYISNIDHSALRYPLKFWADQYKTGSATVTEESLTLQYLLHDISCSDGETPINTGTQMQVELSASAGLKHQYLSYTAVLGSPADVTITIGGKNLAASWVVEPEGGVGVYYGYILVEDYSGSVAGSISRDGSQIFEVTGKDIGGCSEGGYTNFNPYVAGGFSPDVISVTTPTDLSDMGCVAGTGSGDFASICALTCENDYCPDACVCTQVGVKGEEPEITGDEGHALNDPNYEGLCSWAYNHGYTTQYTKVCTTTNTTGLISAPTVSPHQHEACIAGQHAGSSMDAEDLCKWSCSYGNCPIAVCQCTDTGVLVPLDGATPPNPDDASYAPTITSDSDLFLVSLCDFACDHDYCLCYGSDDSDSDDDEGGTAPCDYSLIGTFASLDAIYDGSSQWPSYCAGMYILGYLADNMTSTLSQYDAVNDDYDSLFGYYVTYITEMIEPSLYQFMKKNGNDYFECTLSTDGSGDTSGGSSSLCPDLGALSGTSYTINGVHITYNLVNSTGFYADLEANWGISADWVKFDTEYVSTDCIPTIVNGQPLDMCTSHYVYLDKFPLKANTVDVPNPKEVWTAAGANLTALPASIKASLVDLQSGNWGGYVGDAVDVYTMPVALAAQSIAAMKRVKEIGQTEEDTERKNLIFLIVTVVLAVVPFVGEEGAALAGLANMARAAAMAGEAANAAFDIYSMVEDPSSILFTIFGTIFGAAGIAADLRKASSFSAPGKTLRDLSEEDRAAAGDVYKSFSDTNSNILNVCKLY